MIHSLRFLHDVPPRSLSQFQLGSSHNIPWVADWTNPGPKELLHCWRASPAIRGKARAVHRKSRRWLNLLMLMTSRQAQRFTFESTVPVLDFLNWLRVGAHPAR